MAIVKVSRKLLDEWPILDYSQLTRRERQITELLLTGKKRESIVTLLGITSEGVHKHINNVFRKLRVNSHIELIYKHHPLSLRYIQSHETCS